MVYCKYGLGIYTRNHTINLFSAVFAAGHRSGHFIDPRNAANQIGHRIRAAHGR